MTEFRVYHHFRSPYSRLGLHQIARAGLTPDLHAFTGPPDGASFSDPVANPAKRAYYMADAPRMTLRMGLAITPPRVFEVDFDPAIRAATLAAAERAGLAFALAVADARWGEGVDISDGDALAAAAREAGWREDGPAAAQADPRVDEALEEGRRLIERDQVFGVPFAVFGGEKFWGHDRFDLLVERVKTADD